MMRLQTIHIRINDAATGMPTPVRLRVTDEHGTYFAPFGHSAEFPTGRGEAVGGDVLSEGKRWAYIDGTCEIAVPPGELIIEARKGIEYRPIHVRVNLSPGRMALRFSIENWAKFRTIQCFSGDTRASSISPHAALLEAAAEDLAVVNLVAHESCILGSDGHSYLTFPLISAFSGQKPCLEWAGHAAGREYPGSQVVVGTMNTHPILGKLALLNTHRMVFPLSFGGPDATDDWSLNDWCQQCHRKRGLVIWTGAFPEDGFAGEALANLILGEVDAFEIDLHHPGGLRGWYQLLNAGIRVPLVGASGKDSNRTVLGSSRTYAQLLNEEAFSYGAWVEAIRAGRTTITSGPLIRVFVQGLKEGTIYRREQGRPQFRLCFGVSSPVPVDRTELVVNGEVVATGSKDEVFLDLEIPRGGWVAARCWSGARLLAHTSPVYIVIEGVAPMFDAAAVAFLGGHLRKTREWVEREGRFEKEQSKSSLLETFQSALAKIESQH